jgi:cytochrome oxidase Cu insertion factor (SCO1/SenC/PrrC family)
VDSSEGKTAVECDCEPQPPGSAAQSLDPTSLVPVDVPDAPLVDQHGKKVRLRSDLIKDRVVAVNFLFTNCTTSCPLLAANFADLQKKLGDPAGKRFGLISITVDPARDTPARLRQFAERFEAQAGWSLLTGDGGQVELLLRALKAYTPDIAAHPSTVLLIGRDGTGLRVSGLTGAARLAQLMRELDERAPAAKSQAEKYFPDAILVDQHGREHRFYSDLLRGKVVVINVFFSSCKGSCLTLGATQARLQSELGARLGRDLRLISITVDPEGDDGAALRAYAKAHNAGPHWYFLTGKPEDVRLVLSKLGQYVEKKDDHSSVLLIGNDRTGLWKKANGLARVEDLLPVVRSVLDDDPRK